MRKSHTVFVLCLFVLFTLVSCTAPARDTGNRNTPHRTITYFDGICSIAGNDILCTKDDGTTTCLYTEPDGILRGIACDGDALYFLTERETAARYRAVIGKIASDGTVTNDISTALFRAADCSAPGEIGELHVFDDRLFLTGNQIYGSAYLLDLTKASAIELPCMYPSGAYTDDTIFYTKGGYEIYAVTIDALSHPDAETVCYDGAMFSAYPQAPFYNGIGIEHMTSDGETLYFSMAESDGDAVYKVTGSASPTRMYTHPTRITALVCYEGKVYLSDDTAVYVLNGTEPTVLSDISGQKVPGFVIHNGRLYDDLSDFTKFLSLPAQN